MEYVVIWELKPLDLIRIFVVSLHDAVSRWLLLIVVINEVSFDAHVDSELHWQVWEDTVVLGDREIVNHSNGGDRDLHVRDELSGTVEQGVVNERCLEIITKGEEFTG